MRPRLLLEHPVASAVSAPKEWLTSLIGQLCLEKRNETQPTQWLYCIHMMAIALKPYMYCIEIALQH